MSRESLDALERLAPDDLSRHVAQSNWDAMTSDPALKRWLADNPIPAPSRRTSGSLFQGTLVFVQVIFQIVGGPSSSISLADVQTARDYAALAAQPIHRYASQYGPNSIDVWPSVIPFTAMLSTDSFDGTQLEQWVEECAAFVRLQGADNPCVVVLHNRTLPNHATFLNNNDAYHSITQDGTPYCYCLVFGEGLSIADNNHTVSQIANEKVYAHILSHEIAEMVVDPLANGVNPEVCDGCSGNCSANLFNLFDAQGMYLGGTDDTASATGYAFFINPIVKADTVLDSNYCVVPASDTMQACIYPPPFASGELLSFGDDGAPGNVSNPVVVGFDGWSGFQHLFAGRNAAGQDRIYAVDPGGRLLAYGDDGDQGNVSDPIPVGFGGWSDFKFLFGGRDATGQDRIYAVRADGQLLSYGDSGVAGNVSSPITVGFGGWADFKFVFGGRDATGQDRIYAVRADDGRLLSFGDNGLPGNVSGQNAVGAGGWSDLVFVFGGTDATGQDRIYAVNGDGELFSYGDSGTQGNVSSPVTVGFGGWSGFKCLFAGRNANGQARIYASVP